MIIKSRSGQSPARALQTFLQMHMSENTLCTLDGLEEAMHSRGAVSSTPLAQQFFGYLHRCQLTRGSHPCPRSWGCSDTRLGTDGGHGGSRAHSKSGSRRWSREQRWQQSEAPSLIIKCKTSARVRG